MRRVSRESLTVSVMVARRCEVMGGVTTVTGSTSGPRGMGPKYFVEQRLELDRIEIAGNGDGGVVGDVELLVEVAHIGDAGGFNVGVAADHVAVVGVSLGKKLVVDLFVGHVVGPSLALAALVANHVLLVDEFLAVQALHQKAHAIALEPQRKLKLV